MKVLVTGHDGYIGAVMSQALTEAANAVSPQQRSTAFVGTWDIVDVVAHPSVIGRQAGTNVLGVGPLGVGGEAGEVAEHHRDHLALLSRAIGLIDHRTQIAAARRAESGPRRGLGATARAHHGERRPAL